MRHTITGILALFGAFCLFVIAGILGLSLKIMQDIGKEKRQRKQAVQKAERIIHQLL